MTVEYGIKYVVDWEAESEESGGYERSEDPRYAAWIAERYPTREKALAQCAEATTAMAAAFPELRRVAGLVAHGDYVEDLEHWWLVEANGAIVDPTLAQWNAMFILGYHEIKPDSPIYGKPRRKCMNCSRYYFGGGSGICSKRCEVAFDADFKSRRLGGHWH